MTLLSPGPTPSCRTDYLTVTYKLPKDQAVDDLIAYGHCLGSFVLGGGDLQPVRKGRHYSHVFQHDSGVTVELTPPESERRNAGSGLITVPGSVFGALDNSERVDLITDLREMSGFYRCTRWDAQLTTLDPPVQVGDFVDDVSDGNLWVKGFSVGRPWGFRTLTGAWREPPTQYFGSPQSEVQARVYDHGVEHGWEQASMRIELQFRKRWADDHFRRLADRCRLERGKDPLLIRQEELTVKQALGQHFDLRDTSAVDRTQSPSKWLRKAPQVDWYQDLIKAPAATIEKSYKPTSDLWRSREAGCAQYGPKQLLTVVAQAIALGGELDTSMYLLMAEMAVHLNDSHYELIADLVEPHQVADARRTLDVLRRQGAQWNEEMLSEKFKKTPR